MNLCSAVTAGFIRSDISEGPPSRLYIDDILDIFDF